MKKNLYY